MSEQQPLVVGGIINKEQYWFDPHTTPPTFATRTPPVIRKDTIIVAVASPDIDSGSDIKDGWFLSDFYAFNCLLKGLGKSQTWLTAAVSLMPA